MAARSYNQYCAVAQALDTVGDRWTLLLIRELMIGPRRFSDLLDGLPGIGPNHLSSRLKRLSAAGVIERRELPRPAASHVYELTESGRGLESVVVALARWGQRLLGAPDSDLSWRADWTVVALRGRFEPAAAQGVNDTYQFTVDDQSFWAHVSDGELTTALGRAADPTVEITTDGPTFTAVAAGELALDEAVASGVYRIDGDAAALVRAAAIFPTPLPITEQPHADSSST